MCFHALPNIADIGTKPHWQCSITTNFKRYESRQYYQHDLGYSPNLTKPKVSNWA